MKLGCVVMAAGNSLRFGADKLDREFDGKSVFRRALEALPAKSFEEVVVVTRSSLFSESIKGFNFTEVRNLHPEQGVSLTIRLGLSRLLGCDGVLFLVCDQPLLRRETVEDLAALWLKEPGKIAALGHHGKRGNPCLFPARFFPELLALQGDRGGSAVIRRHEEDLVLLNTDPWELMDIDTPQALEVLRTLKGPASCK